MGIGHERFEKSQQINRLYSIRQYEVVCNTNITLNVTETDKTTTVRHTAKLSEILASFGREPH